MAGNLTSQVRNIAEVTTAVAKGDLSQKITVDARRDPRAEEHRQHDGRPAVRVRGDADGPRGGHAGRLGGQAQVPGVGGTWRDLTDSVNFMAGNSTRSDAEVATAVAKGDLSQKIT